MEIFFEHLQENGVILADVITDSADWITLIFRLAFLVTVSLRFDGISKGGEQWTLVLPVVGTSVSGLGFFAL